MKRYLRWLWAWTIWLKVKKSVRPMGKPITYRKAFKESRIEWCVFNRFYSSHMHDGGQPTFDVYTDSQIHRHVLTGAVRLERSGAHASNQYFNTYRNSIVWTSFVCVYLHWHYTRFSIGLCARHICESIRSNWAVPVDISPECDDVVDCLSTQLNWNVLILEIHVCSANNGN